MPQWKPVEPILGLKRWADGRSRPWHDTRAVLTGVLWILGTGVHWREFTREISAVPNLPPPFFSSAYAATG